MVTVLYSNALSFFFIINIILSYLLYLFHFFKNVSCTEGQLSIHLSPGPGASAPAADGGAGDPGADDAHGAAGAHSVPGTRAQGHRDTAAAYRQGGGSLPLP